MRAVLEYHARNRRTSLKSESGNTVTQRHPAHSGQPGDIQQAAASLLGQIAQLLLLVASGLALLFCQPALSAPEPLHLGLSTVVIGEQQATISKWENYLSRKLQRPVNFVQRRSYQKFLEMLNDGEMHAGWIDGSQYLANHASLRLLAVPVWHGQPVYQACLIVPDFDRTTRSIADLRGKIFGYTDPDSTSGHHVPVGEIQREHADPGAFFSKTLYTRSHTKLVRAVAAGLVNGAYVDCYIYEQMRQYFPSVAAPTRMVVKSSNYGFPPIVTRANLPQTEFLALQQALLNMTEDPDGKLLLQSMGLDRFIAGNDTLYDSTAILLHKINANQTRHEKHD